MDGELSREDFVNMSEILKVYEISANRCNKGNRLVEKSMKRYEL